MSIHRTAVLALALAGAASAGAAFAGQFPEACKAGVARLCPGMTPGDGKIRKCM